MADYRLYLLDGSGRIIGAKEHTLASDAEAFLVATELTEACAGVEIWHRGGWWRRFPRTACAVTIGVVLEDTPERHSAFVSGLIGDVWVAAMV